MSTSSASAAAAAGAGDDAADFFLLLLAAGFDFFDLGIGGLSHSMLPISPSLSKS